MAKYDYWLTKDGLLLLTAWARDGLTEEQIAKNCGCSRTTLKDWKKRFPTVLAALKKGKEPVDIEVENALLKRALGYKYLETKKEYEYGQLAKETVTEKIMPPDTTAIAIWLNNRKPDSWRRNPNKEKLDQEKFDHDKDIDAKRYW